MGAKGTKDGNEDKKTKKVLTFNEISKINPNNSEKNNQEMNRTQNYENLNSPNENLNNLINICERRNPRNNLLPPLSNPPNLNIFSNPNSNNNSNMNIRPLNEKNNIQNNNLDNNIPINKEPINNNVKDISNPEPIRNSNSISNLNNIDSLVTVGGPDINNQPKSDNNMNNQKKSLNECYSLIYVLTKYFQAHRVSYLKLSAKIEDLFSDRDEDDSISENEVVMEFVKLIESLIGINQNHTNHNEILSLVK